jgi:hypothetical protein
MYCFKMMFGKFSIWDKFCWEAWNCSVIFLQAVPWFRGGVSIILTPYYMNGGWAYPAKKAAKIKIS